ncbi:hypothetical protein VNI00_018662 [Paramarasmius palmivorus]|uniref:BTB domain-containing protein n=1 Tax=Paramarasmius palmivorus TaxID=297713 RepID=A0AAW0AVV8_9AGAR
MEDPSNSFDEEDLIPPSLPPAYLTASMYRWRRVCGIGINVKFTVSGVDTGVLAHLPLLASLSAHFANAASNEGGGERRNLVVVNINNLSEEAVRNFIDLIYHIDNPDVVLAKVCHCCQSILETERINAVTHLMGMVQFAEEWGFPILSELIQLTLIGRRVLSAHNVGYRARRLVCACYKFTEMIVNYNIENN